MSGVRKEMSAKTVTAVGRVKGWGKGLSARRVESVRWWEGTGWRGDGGRASEGVGG